MGVTTYRPANTDVIEGTDQLDDHVHQIGLVEQIPRLVQRQRNAVLGDRRPVWYYQRKKFAPWCTCSINTSMEPSKSCPVCFGSGKVGAYNKIGTESIVVWPNFPKMVLINAWLDDITETEEEYNRPWRVALQSDSLRGIAQGSFDVPAGVDAIDYIRVYGTGNVTCVISKVSPINWVAFNKANLMNFANERKLLFRVRLERENIEEDLPYFTHILIRYQINDMIFNTDRPRITQAISLEDFGLDDIFQQGTYYFTADLKTASTEDWFYDLNAKKRWKIIEAQDNKPLEILTSWDITARVIQPFEPMYDYPL